MMEVIFRYFYAYHYDKKYEATDIFIEGFNSINQSVRFALSDELILFFRTIMKIGKAKFVDFLFQKSSWLQEIYSKVSTDNYVGYAKEILIPYPNLRIFEGISVPSGKI